MNQRVSLPNFLAIRALNTVIRKRLIGKPYVIASHLFCVQQLVFEQGMLLGCKYRNKLPSFVKCICRPGSERNCIAGFSTLADGTLSKVQGEPKSFLDVCLNLEVARFGKRYPEDIPKMNRIKLPANVDVINSIEMQSVIGIAFGCLRPYLVEKIWNQTYGSSMNAEQWDYLHKVGLYISEEPLKYLTFEDALKGIVSFFEMYLLSHRKELVAELL